MIEYNTVASGGDYEIRFKTDNKESYREIEKHIQYLIDKSVVEREKMQLSTGDKEQIALLQKQVKDLNERMNYCNI